MAKSHQKSNREIRKPKMEKPKPVVQASTFGLTPGKSNPKKGSVGNQKR
jgi:hypothetical protein